MHTKLLYLLYNMYMHCTIYVCMSIDVLSIYSEKIFVHIVFYSHISHDLMFMHPSTYSQNIPVLSV